jgi:hypothetical protein
LYLFRSGSFALSKGVFGVGLRLANSGGVAHPKSIGADGQYNAAY